MEWKVAESLFLKSYAARVMNGFGASPGGTNER